MNRSRGAVVFDNGKSIAATRLSRPFVGTCIVARETKDNPYAPLGVSLPIDRNAREANSKTKSNLTTLILPTIAGAICGSILFAPFVRGPGDPNGHMIGFGLAGLMTLLFTLAIRPILRRAKQ